MAKVEKSIIFFIFVHRQLLSRCKFFPPKAFHLPENLEYRFSRSESQNGLIFNPKFGNVNFSHVRKQSRTEKFGHFRPSTEELFFSHQKIHSGQQPEQQDPSNLDNSKMRSTFKTITKTETYYSFSTAIVKMCRYNSKFSSSQLNRTKHSSDSYLGICLAS